MQRKYGSGEGLYVGRLKFLVKRNLDLLDLPPVVRTSSYIDFRVLMIISMFLCFSNMGWRR